MYFNLMIILFYGFIVYTLLHYKHRVVTKRDSRDRNAQNSVVKKYMYTRAVYLLDCAYNCLKASHHEKFPGIIHEPHSTPKRQTNFVFYI